MHAIKPTYRHTLHTRAKITIKTPTALETKANKTNTHEHTV